MDKIAAETDLSFPRLSDRTSRDIDRFLNKELVHHDTDHAALVARADMHEWTLRAYEALLELARNPLSNSALSTLDEVRGLLNQSSKIFGRLLIDYEVDLEDVRSQAQAATGERDGLRARQIEILTEKAAALAELAARAEAAETARDEAVRAKEGIAQTLAAIVAERAALDAAHQGIAVELQSRQQELAEKAAALAELASCAEQAERVRDEAVREKDGLSQTLAAALAERDALRAAHAGVAGELQSRQDELAELAERAEQAEAGRDDAAREKEALLRLLASSFAERDALEIASSELVAELQAHRELLDLARAAEAAKEAARAELASDLDRARQAAANALAEAQNAHEARMQALRGELVDAEAALAGARRAKGAYKAGAWLTPTALSSARLAKRLLRSGLFDAEFYRAQYSAALSDFPQKGAKSELAAATHYLEEGFAGAIAQIRYSTLAGISHATRTCAARASIRCCTISSTAFARAATPVPLFRPSIISKPTRTSAPVAPTHWRIICFTAATRVGSPFDRK